MMQTQANAGVVEMERFPCREPLGLRQILAHEALRKSSTPEPKRSPRSTELTSRGARRDGRDRGAFRSRKKHFAASAGRAGHSNKRCSILRREFAPIAHRGGAGGISQSLRGFVWQRHHLLPDFTAAENVAMPLLVRGEARAKRSSTAKDWLAEVGLADRAEQRAGELSGGEQQRVAIARALVNQPDLLLADEPTGDLDERSAESIFELMQRLHRSHHLTSIIATHNFSLARRTDRVLHLEHGSWRRRRSARRTAAYAARPAGAGAKTPGERG